MRLFATFEFIQHIYAIIWLGFPSTLKTILFNPLIIFRPTLIQQVFLTKVWSVMGSALDEHTADVKKNLIYPNAFGVVLDIGAGHGYTAKYLNRKTVTRFIALEPNKLMHDSIRKHANEAGFNESDGSLVILSCCAEDIGGIISSLNVISEESAIFDTVISIQSLCSIGSPQETLSYLVNYFLRPGGQFIFYEHVRNSLSDVAWWQWFWTPLWRIVLGGCELDRPTDEWVSEIRGIGNSRKSAWRQKNIWDAEGEFKEDNLFFHKIGRFVKDYI